MNSSYCIGKGSVSRVGSFLAVVLLVLSVNQARGIELSPDDALLLLNKLNANSSLVERLSEEKRNEIALSPNFQGAILSLLEKLTAEQKATEIIQLKRTVTGIFRESDPFWGEFLKLQEFGEKLEYLVSTENGKALQVLVDDPSLSRREQLIVRKLFTNFIHSSTASLIRSGQLGRALTRLSDVRTDLYTAETWGLLSQVVSAVVKNATLLPLSEISTPKVRDLLLALADRDVGAKDALKQFYTMALIEGGRRGDPALASFSLETLERLAAVEPDVIGAFLLAAKGETRTGLAPKLFERLREMGGVPLGLKWNLVVEGYYGPVVPVLLALSWAFPVAAIVLYIVLRIKRAKPELKVPLRREKKLPGYMRPVQVDDEVQAGDDEYSRLLRMFGLTDSATESEIKSAYRKKMKELHPDRKLDEPLADDENSERFRELKHAYDRILQIRSSWFKGRKL